MSGRLGAFVRPGARESCPPRWRPGSGGGRPSPCVAIRPARVPSTAWRDEDSQFAQAGRLRRHPAVRPRPPPWWVRCRGGWPAVPAAAWRLRKASELVKLLALTPGHRLHREQVTEHLWPHRPADAAPNNLHQALRVARAALGSPTRASRASWSCATGSSACARRATSGSTPRRSSPGSATRQASPSVDRYRAAQELYRGELLPDDPYAEWAAGPAGGARPGRAGDPGPARRAAGARRGRRRRDRDAPRAARARPDRRACPSGPDAAVRHRRPAADGAPPVPAAARRPRARAGGRGVRREPPALPRHPRRSGRASRPGISATVSRHAPFAVRSDRPTRRRHNLPVQLSSFVGREREMPPDRAPAGDAAAR